MNPTIERDVPLKLLLVEDNPDYAVLLAETICKSASIHFDVFMVGRLSDALKRIDVGDIDVVVLDLSLPDCEGLESFNKLHTRAPSVPILIMSGTSDESLAVTAVQQGAQDYLLKGAFDGYSLVAAIRYAIERQRIEDALRRSEERLTLAMEAGNIGIWDWNSKLGGLSVSGNIEKLLGAGIGIGGKEGPGGIMQGALIKWLIKHVHRDDLKGFAAALRGARRTGTPFIREFRVLLADGSIRCVAARGMFYYGSDGAPKRMTGAFSDVSDRIRLEQQLSQSQKMEAIGQLAGGIAHDFNNMLTIIMRRTELALREIGPATPLHAKITMVHVTAERAAALTRQLLAFSRRQLFAPKVIDLSAVVKSMTEMLCRLLGEDIALATFFDPNLWLVKADPTQLEQVLINLAVNARDAMSMGGELTIETANVDADEIYARAHTALNPGSYVTLTVSDNGCGMPPDVKHHVFEPFFTTKSQGEGTGLGLSMVYGIVKQSGGNIYVYSEVNYGTTFKIFLPATSERVSDSGRMQRQKTRLAGGAVLIVEDDSGVLGLVKEALENQSFRLLDAGDPQVALELCRSHKGQIDLLLTDVIMPGMSGPQLAEQARILRPGLKVVFMSGYTDQGAGLADKRILSPDTHLLQKPFTQAQLLACIQNALAN